MSKSSMVWIIAAPAFALAGVPAGAVVLGPDAAACARGGPAMLVEVSGFKARVGSLTIKSYGDPATYFDKGAYLDRIEIKVPAAGPVAVCVPVPRSGTYAVSVKHDVNGSGAGDRADGGGMSGNPKLSLVDLMFKRKPDPARVSVTVRGVAPVPIILNYLQGGAFRPLATAAS